MTECPCEAEVFRQGAAAGAVMVLAALLSLGLLQRLLTHRSHKARERRRLQHEIPARKSGEE